jgi:hypothetical protein
MANGSEEGGLGGQKDLRFTSDVCKSSEQLQGLRNDHCSSPRSRNYSDLPTYVRPLDENTKALIDALDAARASHTTNRVQVQ